MFTFHWSELLVIIIGGILLFCGLALLLLRRRNEVLQIFLTPEEPGLEEEFFRVRQKPQEEVPEEETAEEELDETAEVPDENTVQWGTATGEEH